MDISIAIIISHDDEIKGITTPSGNVLLLETGDKLLIETGNGLELD